MPTDLTIHQLLAIAGLVVALPLLAYLAAAQKLAHSAVIAASLSAGFAAFTAVTIWSEGILPVIANHTVNLWGVQVWYDLLMAVVIALFFIVPRARKAGMMVPLWVMFVGATASIGLLAMVARLFWLERAGQEIAAEG
ncbi:hypothetical protein [Pontixanthobacter sp.]|uniref:hypothetical protein n=1 Tax=Pontixanthobacter sp. TaxID=2792078 RepID=UPI003C7E0F92